MSAEELPRHKIIMNSFNSGLRFSASNLSLTLEKVLKYTRHGLMAREDYQHALDSNKLAHVHLSVDILSMLHALEKNIQVHCMPS